MKEFGLVLRFLVAPMSSWQQELKSERTPAIHEKGWFYPLLAIAGATSFVQMAYGTSLTEALIRGIAIFAGFFLGYMLCPTLLAMILGKAKAKGITESDLKTFVMFCYAPGVVVAIIQNVLPTSLTPLYIFLVYELFVLSKCASLFGMDTDERKLWFAFGSFAAMLAVPLAMIMILSQFIPEEAL